MSRRRALVLSLALGSFLGATSVAGQPGSPTEASPQTLGEALAEAERIDADRGRLNSEVERLSIEHGTARVRLRRRVRALYRLRRAGALPLSGGFDALLRHQSRLNHLERLVTRDARALRSMARRVSALRAETAHLAEAAERSERRVAELRLHEEAQRTSLSVLSEMIEDPAAWSGPAMEGFGVRLTEPAARGFRLGDQRGRLPLPVGGSAQLNDSEREGGVGLELATAAGVSVRAVGPGTVAFAAVHPAYGRLAIVDHEDGHYTVYGGLGSLAVRSGQPIARDSVLGTVGAQPLFFQVRRGTRPLSAREWLGI